MFKRIEDNSTRQDEPAWRIDDGKTNYRLKAGDKVRLIAMAVGDGRCKVWVPPGPVGKVVNARTPRVVQPHQRKPGEYIYFANVDFTDEDATVYRVRVPHCALQKVRHDSPAPEQGS